MTKQTEPNQYSAPGHLFSCVEDTINLLDRSVFNSKGLTEDCYVYWLDNPLCLESEKLKVRRIARKLLKEFS